MSHDDSARTRSATDPARKVRDAIARARRAQPALAALSLKERATLLRDVRATLLERAESLIDVVMRESGKVRFEAITLEIVPSALALTWNAHAVRHLDVERIAPFFPMLPRRATRAWRPRGVCGLISPLNYTLAIPMGTIAAALAAGNSVVWKPAETGARAARALVDVVTEAARDIVGESARDLVVVVEGGADVGRTLIEDDGGGGLDHLTFVGSTHAGKDVAARCGARLLPCVIELGGSAPAIVLDGLDERGVERAARAIVYGGLANGGQSCVAVERVFAVPSVFDALLDKTAALADRVRPGVDVAALSSSSSAKLSALRADAERAGARFVGTGGVVDCTHSDARCVDDEIFGPLIPFVKVRDVDEAIARANAHDQQLAAYVFGPKRAARAAAERLRAPHVVIGDTMIGYAMMELPFGGSRGGGWGRVHGVDGLRALCEEQIVVDGHLPIAGEPWWLPYDNKLGEKILTALGPALRVLDALDKRRR